MPKVNRKRVKVNAAGELESALGCMWVNKRINADQAQMEAEIDRVARIGYDNTDYGRLSADDAVAYITEQIREWWASTPERDDPNIRRIYSLDNSVELVVGRLTDDPSNLFLLKFGEQKSY